MKTRLEEVANLLKTAKWAATGGYELWCQYEGRHLTLKEQHIEQDKRIEEYVRFKVEYTELAK